MKILLGIIGGLLTIILGTSAILSIKKMEAPQPEQIACARDVRQCPDGSAVTRGGPNCAFAECTSVSADNMKDSAKPVYCTMEAKLCPDGSAVGRTGPKCEFAECPNAGVAKETETTIARLGQRILSSGVHITPLEVLGDSRCPVDVTCIWAGTVNLRVKLEKGNDAETMTIKLGTEVAFAGKRVSLVSITPVPHSKNVIVSQEYRFKFLVTGNVSVSGGTLEGIMTIGPVCPVERIDHPCLPTPEMFAARKIAVYKVDKKTLVTTVTPDGDGKFSTLLSTGSYYVDMADKTRGPGGASGLPTAITIKQGATVHIEISIDTGIR